MQRLALNKAVSIVTSRLQKAKRLFSTHQVYTVYTELIGIHIDFSQKKKRHTVFLFFEYIHLQT